MTSFRDQMRARRPDVIRRQEANAAKRASARELLLLRWDAAMSESEVAKVSGLDLEVVRQLEFPGWPPPRSGACRPLPGSLRRVLIRIWIFLERPA